MPAARAIQPLMPVLEILEYIRKLRSTLSRALDALRDLRTDIVLPDDPRRGLVDDIMHDAEELLA